MARTIARLARWGRHALIALGIILLSVAPAGGAGAAAITPRAALERLMTAAHYQESWFAPVFLAQVKPAQVEQLRAALVATLGPYRGVQPQPDGSFIIQFQKGTDHAQIHVDNQGRIDGLFFGPPQLARVSTAAAVRSLERRPGHVSILVTANGSTRVAIDAAQPLAVGSSFKLAVLAALQRRIKAGTLAWTQLVTLQARDKSFSSLALQKQPAGARFTIAKLAEYMISVSDNTAADVLIRVVGRAAIDPLIPARDRPILTTHDAFVLKDPARRALREQYLHGTPAQRVAALEQADQLPLPSLHAFKGPLLAPEVEWFFSAQELCGLMQQVHSLHLMSVNPGVANPRDWQRVAYKGGSEPGVLNLTTMLTAHNGTTYCVSATWNNNAPLDEMQFESVYGGLLQSLKAP